MKCAKDHVQTEGTLFVSFIGAPGRLWSNYVSTDVSPFQSCELQQADKVSC